MYRVLIIEDDQGIAEGIQSLANSWGIHVCFAFPVIKKLLALFGLFNSSLFVITSAISFLVFAVLYVLVYRATSNAYFHIVSNDTV